MIKVIITGSTGMLGTYFIQEYGDKYDITILNRDTIHEPLSEADILLNCIGDVTLKPLMDTSISEFDSMVTANMKIPFLLAQKFAINGGKHIINIGSTRSITPAPDKAIYSATKAGLRFLTQSIAMETEVKTSLICPGSFSEDNTVSVTVKAIDFVINNPEIKEMVINGQL